jgi:hypothetical protein
MAGEVAVAGALGSLVVGANGSDFFAPNTEALFASLINARLHGWFGFEPRSKEVIQRLAHNLRGGPFEMGLAEVG